MTIQEVFHDGDLDAIIDEAVERLAYTKGVDGHPKQVLEFRKIIHEVADRAFVMGLVSQG